MLYYKLYKSMLNLRLTMNKLQIVKSSQAALIQAQIQEGNAKDWLRMSYTGVLISP